VTRVPLMIKMPGQTKGFRIKQPAQPVDIFPTVMDVAGVKTDLRFDGLSLGPLLRRRKVAWPRRYAFSSPAISEAEPAHWTTITGEGWTLALGGDVDDKPLLFNLAEDPNQTRNLASKRKDMVARMGQAYIEFLRKLETNEKKIAVFERKVKRFSQSVSSK